MTRVFVALCVLVVAVPAFAQHSALRIGVSLSDYSGEVYTDGPQDGKGTFVFFRGEKIHLNLSLGNSDRNQAHDVVTSAETTPQGFTVRAYRDDRPVRVDVNIDARGALSEGAVATPVDWVPRFSLPPSAHIEWAATTTIDEVGVYVLQIYPLVTDEGGKDVPSFGALAFEVRARTPQAELELIRRQASRELHRGELDLAETTTRKLLRQHPNSSIANILLAEIESKRGKALRAQRNEVGARQSAGRAASSYRRAASLLESASDNQLAIRPEESRRWLEMARRRALEEVQ